MPNIKITVSAHPIKPPKIHNPKPQPPPVTVPSSPPAPVPVPPPAPPPPPVATSYHVAPGTFAPVAASQLAVTAQLRDQNGASFAAAGRTVTWTKVSISGSGSTFATSTSLTDANGLASNTMTTVANEAFQIVATDNSSITGISTTVTVGPVAPPPPDVTPASITIAAQGGVAAGEVGTHVQFTASVFNAESATIGVSVDAWHSSDTSKATIDASGLLTVVGAGTTSITATISSPALTSNAVTFTGSAIPDPPPISDNTPASITISGPASALVGNQAQFTAVVKNASNAVLTGVQPDAWHSSNTGVATITTAGGLASVVAEGSVSITASIASPSVTSNTLTFQGVPLPSSDSEPVYDSGTDTLLINETFDSYATVADFIAQQTHAGLHLGSNEGGASASLVAGRSGGNAYRITYTNQNFNIGGGAQEIHKIETFRDGHAFDDDAQGSWDDLTFGKTLIVQDWRRVTCPGGMGVFDDIAMKWMEFFQPGGDSNLRQLFYTTNHGTYPSVWPTGAIFATLGKDETFYASGPNTGLTADGKQDVPHPTIGELAAAGVWFKTTFAFRGHTSSSQKDGFARMWITCPSLGYNDPVEVVRVRQDAVDVAPSGSVGDGHGSSRPWCIQADVDKLHLGNSGNYNRSVPCLVWYHQLISFTGNNFDGGAKGFTVDTDDILVFTRP